MPIPLSPPPPAPSSTPVDEVVVHASTLRSSPLAVIGSISRPPGYVIVTAPRLDEGLSVVPGASLFRRTSSLGANPTTQGLSLRGIGSSGASRAIVTLDGIP